MSAKRHVISEQEIQRRLDQIFALMRIEPDPGSTWADLDDPLEDTHWAWPGWLPRGYLTVLGGESGIGKSTLALYIAACCTAGLPWPDGAEFTAPPGRVVWIECENAHEVNRNRARAWGLDPSRITNPLANSRQKFSLDIRKHVNTLWYHALRPDVRLVVVDSLSGLLSHRTGPRDTARALNDLTLLARTIHKPVLVTHHLRKPTAQDNHGEPSPNRLRGSSVISQIARVIWQLERPDPAEPGSLLLSVSKNNLASFPDPISVTINDHGLDFGPPPQPPPPRLSQQDRAAAFLQELLADGPVPVRRIKAEGQAAGLSGPTLDRAKNQLGIIPRKSGKAWYWHLPGDQ